MPNARLAFLIVLLLLFGAVAFLKTRPAGEDPAAADSTAYTARERDALRQFWAVYREATDLRLAGRLDAAAAAYRDALRLNDAHEDALYYLGNVEAEQGRLADARTAWERLARLNPNSARAYVRLGDLRFCLAGDSLLDPVAAKTAYERAHAINREETGPLLRLGQVALVRGDLDAARAYFDDVLGSNFASVPAAFLNGYVAWRTGDAARADSLFGRALANLQKAPPPAAVPGEGDTRTGRAMTEASSDCALFKPHLDALRRVAASSVPASSFYRDLDETLTRRRTG